MRNEWEQAPTKRPSASMARGPRRVASGAWVLALVASAALGCGDDDSRGGPGPSSRDAGATDGEKTFDGDVADAAAADAGPSPDASLSGDADVTTSDGGRPSELDPMALFAPLPDTSESLTNVSTDLDAVLERGALEGACEAWAADATNRRLELLCGKAMFFYEGFGGLGIPKVLYEFLGQNFDAELGAGYAGLGLVPDPRSTTGHNLGVGAGKPSASGAETVAFTCASCHFAQLPDGRYAVGAPNHRYDYGKHILAISILPLATTFDFSEADHAPAAIAVLRPALDRLASDFGLRVQFGLALLPLVGEAGAAPSLGREYEEVYARLAPGTMDFMMAPLPDDEVVTVSKIIDLWDLPSEGEIRSAGMAHALLASTGSVRSLMQFIESFVVIAEGDVARWPRERLEPLYEYVLSLRAPSNPSPPTAEMVAQGAEVYVRAGCLDCHRGPRGGGLDFFTFEEIGTDEAMRRWGDPELTGSPCCGLDDDSGYTLTHGIKAPRLTGMWAKSRFLHNGAVASLEELLCVAGPRPTTGDLAFGAQGHTFGCELGTDEKQALLAFLRAH